MAYKPLWDWMDKHEGRKEGSSHEAMEKEKARQGYKKKKVASKMKNKKDTTYNHSIVSEKYDD